MESMTVLLRATTPHFRLRTFDEAGHAFFDDMRASYVPSAATPPQA
jgi:dienelactone hydrolase